MLAILLFLTAHLFLLTRNKVFQTEAVCREILHFKHDFIKTISWRSSAVPFGKLKRCSALIWYSNKLEVNNILCICVTHL